MVLGPSPSVAQAPKLDLPCLSNGIIVNHGPRLNVKNLDPYSTIDEKGNIVSSVPTHPLAYGIIVNHGPRLNVKNLDPYLTIDEKGNIVSSVPTHPLAYGGPHFPPRERLYNRLYHCVKEEEMDKMMQVYGMEFLNGICLEYGDHESLLHKLAHRWWPNLLERACEILREFVNHENRLDATPLYETFFPIDKVCQELKADRVTTLERAKRCIDILLKFGSDPMRTAFRHLGTPFAMGSICVDQELLDHF